MPPMAPMSYKTEAKIKKGKYHAPMKFIMAGPWYIAIIIHRDGKISTTKINVDAQWDKVKRLGGFRKRTDSISIQF